MHRLLIITLTLWLIAAVSTSAGHNITDILSDFPEYSVFNDYLTNTSLADEINSRQSITVLVFNNSVVKKFIGDQSLSVVKPALSIHVLLDYFDEGKLLTIGGGSMNTTTLYQTTGHAAGSTGFVNIRDVEGGKVEFVSADQGSKIQSLYTKTVKLIPYNISVLEINSPIITLEILPVPSAVNIRSLLASGGCVTFGKFLETSGVMDVYQRVSVKGLTIFAPSDAAFKATGLPDFNNLTNAESVALLMYHAVPSYIPQITLANKKGPTSTLATDSFRKFAITIQSAGKNVTLNSGVDDSRVLNMVADSVPVSIFMISCVLLPTELFATSPSHCSVPTPPPETSPPSVSTPAPVSTPIPVTGISPAIPPPAPLTPTSPQAGGAAPADSPTADVENNHASSVDRIEFPMIFLALIMVSISVISF